MVSVLSTPSCRPRKLVVGTQQLRMCNVIADKLYACGMRTTGDTESAVVRVCGADRHARMNQMMQHHNMRLRPAGGKEGKFTLLGMIQAKLVAKQPILQAQRKACRNTTGPSFNCPIEIQGQTKHQGALVVKKGVLVKVGLI